MRKRKVQAVVIKKGLTEPNLDVLYWQEQPYTARLAALEEIRQEYHRWKNDVQPGLQRVSCIIKRQAG